MLRLQQQSWLLYGRLKALRPTMDVVEVGCTLKGGQRRCYIDPTNYIEMGQPEFIHVPYTGRVPRMAVTW